MIMKAILLVRISNLNTKQRKVIHIIKLAENNFNIIITLNNILTLKNFNYESI